MNQATDRPIFTLHAIVYLDAETGEFLAHCLELDLMASGKDAKEAGSDLIDVVTTQIQYAVDHDNFEFLIHPAPQDAWQRFAAMLKGDFKSVTTTLHIEDGQKVHFRPQLDLALAA